MAKNSKSKQKSNPRTYAQIGLWISGIAILACGLLLATKLLAIMKLFQISNTTFFNWALWISLALIVIGLAIYALINPNGVREFLAGRQARHGSNAVILIVAFVGIVFVVNVIIFQNPVQWDWTEDKQHTLAPETIATLKALPSPVQAIAFYTSRTPTTDAQQLLMDIKDNSSGKFSYQFVDPEVNPVEAQQYQVTTDATVVLVSGNHQEMITTVSEQEITNALVRLMNPGKRSVYFLTGHGEHDIQTSSADSFVRAKTVLEAKNYTVQSLNLLAQNQVPPDAKAIIIAGPTRPLSSTETSLLTDYVAHGGSLIVLEEPAILTEANGAPDPLADYLATTWGITLSNDLVIDPNQTSPVLVVADVQNYGSHPITDKLKGQITFFPTASSLKVSTVENVQTTDLVKTIARAWGETDFTALQNQQLSFDATKDISGPLSIAVAAENSSTNGRLVVIGDSEFADDTYFDQYANSDLFINSVDWAAAQENMINLTVNQAITRTMILVSNPVIIVLWISFLCIVPGLVAAGGVASWLIRRARG